MLFDGVVCWGFALRIASSRCCCVDTDTDLVMGLEAEGTLREERGAPVPEPMRATVETSS